MQKILLILLSVFLAGEVIGQKVVENYIKPAYSLQTGPGKNDFVPYNDKGYTLILPEKSIALRGVLVSLDDQKIDLAKKPVDRLPAEANAKGFAVLYVSTGIPIDLYFYKASLTYVDTLLKSVFASYQLPNKNVFFFGTMVSGFRALKYIEYCKTGNPAFNPAIKGVVLCESAIDWVRQWYESQKEIRDHVNDAQVFEGQLVSYLFKTNFHETPKTNIEPYLDFSPYSYFDTELRHIKYYKDMAVRAYTFAPASYWFSANGKGVYDTNYPDMSGLINELKLAGNKQAELVVFTDRSKMKTDQMPLQTNTWNLVNKRELVAWCLSRL